MSIAKIHFKTLDCVSGTGLAEYVSGSPGGGYGMQVGICQGANRQGETWNRDVVQFGKQPRP